MDHSHQLGSSSQRRLRIFLFIILFMGIIWLIPGWQSPLNLAHRIPNNANAASDPVIAAAGDIACDPTNASFNNGSGSSSSCRQKYTSDLLVNAGLAAVLDLGDNQYYCGGYQAFLQSYDLSWGRVKSITHPAVGNHEYLTSGGTDCSSTVNAAGYFQYFGAAAGNPSQGYYSYDIGAWHLIALNTNCSSAGGCGATSPQGKWLEADLTAHTNACVLAYWHIPLFSSGGRANANSKNFWQSLYNHNADLILVGHDHIYERFAPQTPDGIADPVRGIRQFTVGTGGSDHTSIATIAANSELINTNTYGVIKLTLHPTSYDWQFVPEAGKTFTDSGTTACHGSSTNLTPTQTATSTPTQTPTSASGPTATATNTAIATSTGTAGPLPTATPTATATRSPSPQNGLVAAYGFNEGAGQAVHDSSGSGNNGTVSSPAWVSSGKYGGALSFGFRGSRAIIPDSNSLDLTTGMTLEAWVYPIFNLTGGAWKTVIMKEQVGELVYTLYANGDFNQPYGIIYNGGAEHQAGGGGTLPLNTWTHLAVTYDGLVIRFYKNGTLVASLNDPGAILTSTGSLSIGGNGVWPAETFTGRIDEVRIYNRALSTTEIQMDMNLPVP